jgi:hypothetical protein
VDEQVRLGRNSQIGEENQTGGGNVSFGQEKSAWSRKKSTREQVRLGSKSKLGGEKVRVEEAKYA